ncbi:MAG: exonuclease [Acidobacteria bacterium]|nr:MAG: exonuclease [Acidobacteriota bacterium]
MRFAAIDFETASGAQTSACSLGIAVVENGEIVQRKEWLIRPPSLYFNPFNIQVHGITPQMVEHSPEFDALWPEIEREIGDRTLVAHNARFDMGVLRATLVRYDVWCARMQVLCSCSLSRRCWPELPRHSLDALAREFGITFRHHNAEEDAVAAARVVLRAAEEYSAENMDELIERTRIRLGEVSPGSCVPCRLIPRKRIRRKLVYAPIETA